jgi:6-phosphogluconolactonase
MMAQNRRQFLGMMGGMVGGMVGASALGVPALAGGAQSGRLYVGSYGHGIGRLAVDPVTGLPAAGDVVDTPQPSYLALSPDRRTLYAANEQPAGTVSAFAIRAGQPARPLGTRSSNGADPCYVHVHPDGRHLLTANYSSGTVAVHPIRPDGSLGEASDVVRHTGSGPDQERQQGPHAHKVLTDVAGRFVHAVDLGADTVFGYRLKGGTLVPAGALKLPPGSGPRHLSFHPSGTVAYLTQELTSTLTVLRYDPVRGRLTPAQTLPTAPRGDVRNYPSEVVVSRDGRFVYVANRGHNSIATFTAAGDRVTARGTVPCGGNWPRHIAFGVDGRFLYVANQLSDQVGTLRVDPRTGALTPAGPAFATGTPTMVLPL